MFCENCDKLQTELEIANNQCNECDPFEDPAALVEAFGEPFYKPSVKLIGEDGNIFNLMGLCRKKLLSLGQEPLWKQLESEIKSSEHYAVAMFCISKYFNIE